jgi:hypothetical protein
MSQIWGGCIQKKIAVDFERKIWPLEELVSF